jgi:hypothetical protein
MIIDVNRPITGKTLIDLGYKSGPWFSRAIAEAEAARKLHRPADEIRLIIDSYVPAPPTPLHPMGFRPFHLNIEAVNEGDADNINKVSVAMDHIMRVPTVVAGAIMPDACPTGGPGEIPVGGVVATQGAIHPGWHSSDICCSLAMSVLGDVDPKAVLDAGMALTHFGPGGRPRSGQIRPNLEFLERMNENSFMKHVVSEAIEHNATQGDGNHFFYVGRVASTGHTAIVTHHGSRKPGALLYKMGMVLAEKNRKKICPEAPPVAGWIDADTYEGEEYWNALQLIREWTKNNHMVIHHLVSGRLKAKIRDQMWNEHNFIFRKTDGHFYHAKGATPAYKGYAADETGVTLIPLNMAEPILMVEGLDAPNGLGFSPHGAGRNYSRTAFMNSLGPNADKKEIVAEQTKGIDARFFCGVPDLSELPGAYKNASTVRSLIDKFGLAKVVDTVEPYGCIMAGDWQVNAPWRKKKGR